MYVCVPWCIDESDAATSGFIANASKVKKAYVLHRAFFGRWIFEACFAVYQHTACMPTSMYTNMHDVIRA